MGNGMATLARATSIADLYGAGAYGTIGGVAGVDDHRRPRRRPRSPPRSTPAAVGYTALLWTLAALAAAAAALAFRAERARVQHRLSPAANSSRTPGATARTRASSRRTGSAIALANFPLRPASWCSSAAEPG